MKALIIVIVIAAIGLKMALIVIDETAAQLESNLTSATTNQEDSK